jgi:signal transduction histidine kinase
LGLSICLGIVKEHHGDIRFDSQPGVYTRAIVELPTEEGALV